MSYLELKLPIQTQETRNVRPLAFFFKASRCSEKEISQSYRNFDKDLFLDLITELLKSKIISANLINNLSINQYNLSLYNELQQIYTRLDISKPVLSGPLIRKLCILESCSLEVVEHMSSIIRQLMTGYQMQSNLEQTAAPYLLAAIKENKIDRYDFMPTILFVDLKKDNVEELREYLSAVSQLPRPVHERFLLADGHWQSGEIIINEQGDVKLFVSDSEAKDEEYAQGYAEAQFDLLGLQSLFQEKTVELYFLCDSDRQHTGGTCSTFALDDVRHFYTIDKYGPEESLFQQLDARLVKNIALADGTVMHLCLTPPSLQRTMQSRRVFQTIPTLDQERVINKRSQTIGDSVLTNFSKNASGALESNKRLEVKAQHMLEKLDDFIMKHLEQDPIEGYKQINDLANEHTLGAFRTRFDESRSLIL
jgi:hypothetical protein